MILTRHWAPPPAADLAARIASQANLSIAEDEVEAFARFLVQSQPSRPPTRAATGR